ncbi:SDR family NAD(P)-dependent oxidoreductase [uncultured Herbaspirillum sp.]|uniref:SDR family NAD(P)-dependent oxidoreductase n=1 Tax=uncultured Herbaspirillum sp. TaxID=160236 RepID=UPI002589C6AC|nr:SDR family NAD(P)-dependent oxidoreductase [uncultured Herbaspirillum sp.]
MGRSTKKVVAITGGFGILGDAVGRAFVAAGWSVALVDLAPTPAALPDDVLALGGVDITRLEVVSEALGRVVREFGRLDALINVAGGFRWETLADGALDTWDLMYRMNVRTAATASKAALAHLTESGGGRIVNIAAASALKSNAGMGAYAASKSGVMRLTEALAEEHKGTGLTVNAILPGMIDTPQNRKDMPDADHSSWVQPVDIANVIVFLASDAAQAVTGALIPVTGKL